MDEASMIAYRIEAATLDDLPGIIALFDDALAWLNRRGITGQWGTTPFSALPTMREHFGALIDREAMFVARSGREHEPIGTVAVGPHVPAYALPVVEGLPGPAYYLEALSMCSEIWHGFVRRDSPEKLCRTYGQVLSVLDRDLGRPPFSRLRHPNAHACRSCHGLECITGASLALFDDRCACASPRLMIAYTASIS